MSNNIKRNIRGKKRKEEDLEFQERVNLSFKVIFQMMEDLRKRIDTVGEIVYNELVLDKEYTEEEIQDFEERGKIPRRAKRDETNVKAKIEGE